MSSPVTLAASGLPLGATASFNPAYLPPANTPAAFVLTIQTVKMASVERYSDPKMAASMVANHYGEPVGMARTQVAQAEQNAVMAGF